MDAHRITGRRAISRFEEAWNTQGAGQAAMLYSKAERIFSIDALEGDRLQQRIEGRDLEKSKRFYEVCKSATEELVVIAVPGSLDGGRAATLSEATNHDELGTTG